jgi:hypothetical protein
MIAPKDLAKVGLVGGEAANAACKRIVYSEYSV